MKVSSKRGIRDLIVEEATKTKRRQNSFGTATTVHRNTVKKYTKEMGNFGATQNTTEARVEAESDPRNQFSMMAAIRAFTLQNNGYMIFNWDATHFELNYDSTQRVAFKSYDYKKPLAVKSKGKLPFNIKYIHLHNAAGNTGPPIYIVEDNSMGGEDFDVHGPIKGLTSGKHDGYLVFAHSRSANKAFYRWFNENVLTRFVQSQREYSNSAYADGLPMRAFVYCDGEEKQLECFQEAQQLSLLDNYLIDLGKTPASCFAVTQSSDIQKFFKAAKKIMNNVTVEATKDIVI